MASLERLELSTHCLEGPHPPELLATLTVTELAELSGFSKSYISQVKHGKSPASPKLLNAIEQYIIETRKPNKDLYQLFMQSRLAKGISPTTVRFYEVKLGRFFIEVDADKATQHHIEKFLLQFANLGNRHDYHQAIKTFYIWREHSFGLQNPMKNMPAPKVGKLILPSLTTDQVKTLLDKAEGERDKAIISLFTESGLRLSELTNIKLQDIDWDNHTVKVLGKGNKEGYAPFGTLSEQYLKGWLSQYQPNGNIWGLSKWGISIMLRRLEQRVGFPCNPHTFRRTFACLLRKAGVDSMVIKDLGRWESIGMVQRYTRSVTFNDSLKFYKAPLG